ncbi:MAG: arginine N-succinyltransferase [Chlamydiales bacterium]
MKKSSLVNATLTNDNLDEELEFIISNEQLDFRACFGKLRFTSKTDALINEEVAEALMIQSGDPVRFVTTH